MFISTGVSLLGAQPSGGSLPNVPTNNLKLWWDAGEPTSYPGSGTTVTDISGNGNDGTLINNAAFTGSNGGGWHLPAGNDEVDIVGNFLNSTKNWSACVFADFTGGSYDRIWSGIMNGDSGDLAVVSSTQARMIGSGGAQGYWNNLGPGSFDSNVLNMYTYQCDNRNPFLRQFWKNKTQYTVANSTASATNQIEAVEGFSFGGYDQLPGNNGCTGIAYVALVYDRQLTQTDVDQIYAAYKTRLNLP